MRNLSPLKLDHACVYVVYIDAYDTFKHATEGVGVVVIDVVVGAGVVLLVRSALVDEVVGAGVVLVVLAALVDEVVRAALVDEVDVVVGASVLVLVHHEAVNPSLEFILFDMNCTCMYPVLDV